MKKYYSQFWFRFGAWVGFVLFVLVVYYISALIPMTERFVARKSYFDDILPFMPWTLTIYLSHVLLVGYTFLALKNPNHFKYLFHGYIWLTLLSVVFFISVPFQIPLPPNHGTDFWAWSLNLVRAVDVQANALPSLHVIMAFFGPFYLLRVQGINVVNVLILIWGVLVVLSTMTTGQHHFPDVTTGAAVSLIAFPLGKLALYEDKVEQCHKFKQRN